MAISEPERRDEVAGKMRRRATDRVEDAVVWVLSILALLLVVLAVTASVAAYGHLSERVRAESGGRTPAQVMLVKAAPMRTLDAGHWMPVGVEAQWTGPDGTPRTGSVPVVGPLPAGAKVSVWLDERGDVVKAPPTMVEAVVAAFFTGACVLAGGGAVLAAGWAVARRTIGAANSRRWEREWADVGPRWSGRR